MKTTSKFLMFIALCYGFASCNITHCPELDSKLHKKEFLVKKQKPAFNRQSENNNTKVFEVNSDQIINAKIIKSEIETITASLEKNNQYVLPHQILSGKNDISYLNSQKKLLRMIKKNLKRNKIRKIKNIKAESVANETLKSVANPTGSDSGLVLLILGIVLMAVGSSFTILVLAPLLGFVLVLGGLIMFIVGLLRILEGTGGDDSGF